jgi:GNAT superfamily N-acetyltransferase
LVNDQLCGFMIGLQIGALFGKDKGLVVGAHGWSVHGSLRGEIIMGLLTRVLQDAIQYGHTSIAWTISAHDHQAIAIARDLGFGNRCADALRTTEPGFEQPSSYRIERIDLSQLEVIAPLHQAHNRYYRQAPLWMPNPEEDPLEDLKAWMTSDDRWIWAAFENNQPVGYLRAQAHAESYLSHHPHLRNITAAFVDSAWRHTGVTTALLNQALHDLNHHGIRWCGVDYETINPSGSRFWSTHFEPYTVSLTRRIDERIRDVI